MIYAIKRFIKVLICTALILFGFKAGAQVSLVQQTIDKLEGYKNFSYQSVYKQKDYNTDTTIIQYRDIFLKAPEDKISGYLFKMESLIKGNKSSFIILYNGQNLIDINPGDSTYTMKKPQQTPDFQLSLLGRLNWIKGFIEKKPSKIVKANDTTINAIDSYHLIVSTYDTVINNQHEYARIHLFIDKLSGMPDWIISKSHDSLLGDRVTDYYTESHYFNYKFNQGDIDITSMTVPKEYHTPKAQPPMPVLLVPGTVAPKWTLYAADGKQMSLAQMKGKVVMLDFFFIGCGGCMLSLKPLNQLYQIYKNQNMEIASMAFRDSKQSVLDFESNYHIKYPTYLNAADEVASYHVNGFPTFYFIDKEGKIASVIVGYTDDFEQKAASIIDGLLKQ